MKQQEVEAPSTGAERMETMRTGETAMERGLYVSDCCLEEKIFDDGDTLVRCPKCSALCHWELEDLVISSVATEQVSHHAA
jgi:hypothetical protein